MSAKVPDPTRARLSADRLLEAVAPQLSDELERILDEVRQAWDAEANVRLKKALLEKEAEFRSRAEDSERRIREQTSQSVRAEVTEKLEALFKQQVAVQLDAQKQSLRKEAAEASERWKQERMALLAETERWRVLAEFHRRLKDAASQTEMLRHLLTAADRFSKGVAVYLNKPDGLSRWSAKGEAAFPELVSEDTIDPEWYFAPIIVRSKTVAAVCAAGVSDRESFDVLMSALKRAIENFGLRIRFFGRGGASDPEVEQHLAAKAAPSADGDEDLGADARRLARMLVSEIKLGHEKEVLAGRVSADIYSRLREEIDSGREAYQRQVQDPGSDYFHEELVKILAGNDPSKLGSDYPGPA